jgi:hypothetical protein
LSFYRKGRGSLAASARALVASRPWLLALPLFSTSVPIAVIRGSPLSSAILGVLGGHSHRLGIVKVLSLSIQACHLLFG